MWYQQINGIGYKDHKDIYVIILYMIKGKETKDFGLVNNTKIKVLKNKTNLEILFLIGV